MNTLVSVIIPVFNREAMIGMALRSVLRQSNQDFEILVVDDRSTDRTCDIVQSFNDPRIHLLSNCHKKGPAGARNTGLETARGKYIAFLDSDDRFLRNHLKQSADILNEHSEISLVFGRARYIQNGRTVPYMRPRQSRILETIKPQKTNHHYTLFPELLFDTLLENGCFFNTSTVVFRKELVSKGLLMDENLFIGEDYEYWLRLSARCRFAYHPAYQCIYSITGENISVNSSLEQKKRQLNDAIHLYRATLRYPWITRQNVRMIHFHMAREYFDFGYDCQRNNHLSKALNYYSKSMKEAPSLRTTLAWIKTGLRLPLAALRGNSHNIDASCGQT